MPHTPNGGPAHPVVLPGFTYGDGSHECSEVVSEGLTIRDWFAGQALAVVAAFGAVRDHPDDLDQTGPGLAVCVAQWAYQIADALIAHRKES